MGTGIFHCHVWLPEGICVQTCDDLIAKLCDSGATTSALVGDVAVKLAPLTNHTYKDGLGSCQAQRWSFLVWNGPCWTHSIH
jgi:hypothetical protein